MTLIGLKNPERELSFSDAALPKMALRQSKLCKLIGDLGSDW